MSEIKWDDPTPTEHVADRLDTFRIAWGEIARRTGREPDVSEVVALSYFLAEE